MLSGKYSQFHKELLNFLPEDRIFTDELRTLAYGTDAGFYRLIPEVVIKAEWEEEIVKILKLCGSLNLSVTFRAAGTSLSGQAISDSVLVLLGTNWRKYSISDDISKIKLQPGIIGAHANLFLAPYNKKIGPDPASINAAMIGGIAANNASGMCCGTAQNSYKTLAGMRIVFYNGDILDTTDQTSISDFITRNPGFIESIRNLSEKTKSNQQLAEKICHKYKLKNTTGYSLNALIDFEDPVDIIQHLMIGSEGTLGFISEITYYTVPDLPFKSTSLMLFPDIITACQAVSILKESKVEAVELMDRAALRSVENKEGMPSILKRLDRNAAALLVELRSDSEEELNRKISLIYNSLEMLPKAAPLSFTSDPKEFKKLWDIRKGLFPSVGAMRETGTTVIIEDVAFPVPKLAEAAVDLQKLFLKYDYNEAIIFGHALEGNLHFVFKQDFNILSEVTRYKSFIEDVTKLVVNKYNGSLKAEHGTGRNMAPFVELEWGTDAYKLMHEIKNIFDPEGILNPGVILNSDNSAHIKNLKPLPEANAIIDKCIECGFCEINCPSRNLTLTPRQRIVAYREIARLNKSGKEPERLDHLVKEYDYFGNQTCATDGLCATSCPVEINTGNLIKHLRMENSSATANSIADFLSANMTMVTNLMRIGLNFVNIFHFLFGTSTMESISKLLYKISGRRIPLWNKYMPKGGKVIKPSTINGNNPLKVVYFPSCINRAMGLSSESVEGEALTKTIDKLLKKAGYEVIYPGNIDELCCGMAFASKGFKKQGDRKSEQLINALIVSSENGKYPVLFDMSPCLYRMKEYLKAVDNNFEIHEPVEFISKYLVDKLKFTKTKQSVAIHSTCSSIKLGLSGKLKEVASLCADNVIAPENIGCCGWAGDRGFTYPELNASALEDLKDSIPADCKHGYSTSKTCEIGLSIHSGISYESIIYLVDESTVPAK